MPPGLETQRLLLRPLTAADGPWYLAHFSRPEIVHGSGFPAPADQAAADAELRRYVLDLVADGSGMRWGISLGEDEELIGSIGYYGLVEQPVRRVEIGYDLAPDHWGHGYVAEALGSVVAYCRESLGIRRIEALVLSRNERSARVLTRAGFHCEALLHHHGTDEHAELMDEMLFVLTC